MSGTYDGQVQIWYAADAGAQVVQPDFTGTVELTMTLHFGGVVLSGGWPEPNSGSWTGNDPSDPNTYPDVAWHTSVREIGNPYVWPTSVDSIVQGLLVSAVALEDSECRESAPLSILPNPLNPSGRVTFQVPFDRGQTTEAVAVDLAVFDIHGKRVAGLALGPRQPGVHTVCWNGTSTSGVPMASGIYFIRYTVEDKCYVKKAVLLK